MSIVRWIGAAQSTAEIDTITIGTYDATTTYSVTINNKTYSSVGTGGTASTTAAALQVLLNASVEPEFTEWTWSVAANVITATQKVAGRPGTITATVSGGTGTITHAVATANTSPNDIDNLLNYSPNALPAASNTLIIDASAVSLLYNLGSLSSITLASLTRRMGFTGSIGLPEVNTAGYWEYRATEFAIAATTVLIEQPSTDGVAAVKFNVGSVASTLTVLGQSSGSVQLTQEQMWWRGTNSSNGVNVLNGSLAIAPVDGISATVATLAAESSTVRCGTGVTLTTVNNLNSLMEFNSSIGTAYNQNGISAVSYFKSAAAATLLNIYGGTCYWQSSGGIAGGTITGTLDFSQGTGSVAVSGTLTLGAGAVFNDPNGRCTFSGSPSFQLATGVNLSQVTINLGAGRNYTVV